MALASGGNLAREVTLGGGLGLIGRGHGAGNFLRRLLRRPDRLSQRMGGWKLYGRYVHDTLTCCNYY